MLIKGFEGIIRTENRARLYFRKYCWKSGHVFCTRCSSYKAYRIAGRRYRCKRCGYTFHDFTDRRLDRLNISYKNWAWLVKLFGLELSANQAARHTGHSYPTVLKAFDVIRYAIISSADDAAELLGGEIELDESYFGGRRKGKRGLGAGYVQVTV